nr:MAG TPA: hypothetical protein [Herelleviridae sp.]
MLPPVKIGRFALIRRSNVYFIIINVSMDDTRKQKESCDL